MTSREALSDDALQVRVLLSTHDAGAITMFDIELARDLDRVAARYG